MLEHNTQSSTESQGKSTSRDSPEEDKVPGVWIHNAVTGEIMFKATNTNNRRNNTINHEKVPGIWIHNAVTGETNETEQHDEGKDDIDEQDEIRSARF